MPHRNPRLHIPLRSFCSRLLLLLGLLAMCLLPGTALAQDGGTIEGHVTPGHSHDIVLATARIPDLALQVDVDGDGNFRFDDVPSGSYLVVVRIPSLGATAERAEVAAGETTQLDIVLKPGGHFDEIVVTASADARSNLELATPTTVLSGEELALRVQPTLGETLSQEAGISSTFFGPGASRPVIRGLTGDRVRMLESGLGTGDVSGVSADHAVTADPGQAERIEVIRGPATLLYGSSAVGGVVNVIDERIPSHRATGGVNGDVTLRGNSVDEGRTGSVNLNGGKDRWAWHVDAIARETEDYDIPGFAVLDDDEHGDEHEEHEEEEHEEEEHEEEEPAFGTVPNTNIETQGGRVGVTYFGDRGFFGISVSGFETDYGLPGGLEHAEHEEEGEHEEHEEEEHEEEEHEEDEHEEGVPVRIDMEQRRIDLKGEITQPFGAFQGLKLRLGSTDYEHIELEGDEEGTFFFNEFIEGRLELVQKSRDLKSGAIHSGSFGTQLFTRDLEAIGAEAFLPQTQTDRWALFTLQEIETGNVRWQFGARFESQDSDPADGPSRSHDGLSGSLGMVWQANDAFSIGASLSRSVKLPAAEELFSNGLHVATQAFEIGDVSLTEEIGLGFDVSLRLEQGPFSGELTFFRQDFDDFIFQAFTGGEEDGFPVVVYSQEDAELSGFELTARIELLDLDDHHLHLRLVGDMVDAELDAGGYLPRIPPTRLGAGLHYHSEGWTASAEVQWVDDQTDVAVNESATEGYTLFNASLGYRVLFKQQILDILLRGRNLGDEDARAHTSFLKNVAPLPGRDVALSLKFLF